MFSQTPPRIDFRWPAHASGAVTSSWDDGTVHDRRLVRLFREHGFKGTFYLNSGAFADLADRNPRHIDSREIAELYQGLEIGSHTVFHPFPWRMSNELLFADMIEDRRRLEVLGGTVVRGFVFPFGRNDQSSRLQPLAARAGFRYARASHIGGRFSPPGDFLEWAVSCHCGRDLPQQWEAFKKNTQPDRLFYVWGHSYEFEETHGWEHIENFVRDASAVPGLWFATNGEIHDYVTAWRSLEWSLDRRIVRNPSAFAIDFVADGTPLHLAPGRMLRLCPP